MIIAFAVMSILALIACALLYASELKAKDLSNQLFEERSVSSNLRNEKHHEWERTQIAIEEGISLKTELADALTQIEELKPQPTAADADKGHFITSRELKRATPETYRNVFDLDLNGQRVLDHLQLTFASKATYVRGGHDAERESCFRSGQASVISFMFNQINKANNPNQEEQADD